MCELNFQKDFRSTSSSAAGALRFFDFSIVRGERKRQSGLLCGAFDYEVFDLAWLDLVCTLTQQSTQAYKQKRKQKQPQKGPHTHGRTVKQILV
ncbi:unnamed protein product [Ceratitis capitata]|uniref:(Mediterranean fruit fly) hypothetical protein n=1 Tax=Ceratitis capitata TaxID=7213 RepID=A0A811UNH5_CERCA|nr:unnamed protein product [Ceratitis capitata]